jgi:nitrogen regulatory protein PII
MYGAPMFPMIWENVLFSSKTTRIWSGFGREPDAAIAYEHKKNNVDKIRKKVLAIYITDFVCLTIVRILVNVNSDSART